MYIRENPFFFWLFVSKSHKQSVSSLFFPFAKMESDFKCICKRLFALSFDLFIPKIKFSLRIMFIERSREPSKPFPPLPNGVDRFSGGFEKNLPLKQYTILK